MTEVLESPGPIAQRPPRVRTDRRLFAIRDKLERQERLSLEDGDLLYATPDLWTLCELADLVRRQRTGDLAYYNINRHLNYSNVCALSCRFCDFYAKQGDAAAYTRDLDYVRVETRKAVEAGATEIHSVGGLHPHLPFSYYTDLVSTIRATAKEMGSELHVKAFTAVEIVHLARIAKVYKQDDRRAGIRWVLERLIEAGLGSLPGGGAEVFDDRVHDEAFKGKIRSDVWLDVHKIAHEFGLCTNATILYGHIEDRRDRLVHMDMLRKAQDEALRRWNSGKVAKWQSGKVKEDTESGHFATLPLRHSATSPLCHSATPPLRHSATSPPRACFQTIIPLPFCPDGSALEHLPGPSGLENLRTLAIARLMLDNFPHVKAFWIMQTLPMAQLMLQCGADDLDGTVVWYDITHVGGAGTHQEVSAWTLEKAIRDAGFQPVERDTLYRPVKRDGRRWWVERG
jgi:aminodeoxyfutalosine synthase